MSHQVAPAPPRQQRLVWADAARGLTMVLVVLHHLSTKHFPLAAPEELGAVVAVWEGVSSALKPLRMPLFFMLSGLFAASALHRPWPQVTRKRIAQPYYVYALWLVLHFGIFTVATTLPMNRTQDWGELAVDLVLASTGLWYLYALVVYFVAAKLLLRLDRAAVLTGAAVLSASASLLPIEAANRTSLLQHFVFFLVGAYLPDLVRRLGEMRGWHLVPMLVSTYLVANAVFHWAGLPQSVITLMLSVVAVPLAVQAVVAACALPRFAEAASYVGQRTLPLYVLHVPLISGLHHLNPQLDLGGSPVAWVALAVYPLVATLLVVALALGGGSLLQRVGLRWLFELPGWVTRSASPRRHRARRSP